MYFFYKLAFIDFAKDFHCFFTFMKLAEFFLRQLMSKSAERPTGSFPRRGGRSSLWSEMPARGKVSRPSVNALLLGYGLVTGKVGHHRPIKS